MKFSNSYRFGMNAGLAGMKEKLQKLLGMEKASGEIFLQGEMSCDISIEEMKEIISSEDARLKALREYVADGRLEHDTIKLIDIIGQALCESEKIQRAYDIETNKTRLEADRLHDAYLDARADDVKKRAKKAEKDAE